jgi:hypothetical protein
MLDIGERELRLPFRCRIRLSYRAGHALGRRDALASAVEQRCFEATLPKVMCEPDDQRVPG